MDSKQLLRKEYPFLTKDIVGTYAFEWNDKKMEYTITHQMLDEFYRERYGDAKFRILEMIKKSYG